MNHGIIFALLLVLAGTSDIFAQSEINEGIPLASLADTGSEWESSTDLYWVLETQPGEAAYSLVKFYDPQDRLVHESRYEGILLHLEDRQTRLMI